MKRIVKMKKILTMLLACVMIMGLASVSFALEVIDSQENVQLIGPFVYDNDKKAMEGTGFNLPREDNELPVYGKPVYYLLLCDQSENLDASVNDMIPIFADYDKAVTDHKFVDELKYKATFENGVEIIRGLNVVKKYIDIDATWNDDAGVERPYYCGAVLLNDAAVGMGSGSGYYYFAEVLLAESQSVSETDVIGSLTASRKADNAKGVHKIDDVEFDFGFTVFHKNNWNNGDVCPEIVSDRGDLEYNTNYALKFECDEEVELSFGSDNGGNNEGTFTVDVSGQGKVFLNYNTNPDEAIADANPGAKMFFLNFNNARFNRAGEFVYEMEGIVSAYKVVDGKLVSIPGLVIEDDCAIFRTNKLEQYVFANAELTVPAAVEAVG